MNDTTDTIEPDVIEGQVIELPSVEGRDYIPLFVTYEKLLESVHSPSANRVSPQLATRIAGQYRLDYKDLDDYLQLFNSYIIQAIHRLQEVFEGVNDKLITSAEEDVAELGDRYTKLISVWQTDAYQRELDWDTLSKNAGIQIAAMSEFHNMFFSDTGALAMLDQIGYELSEDDRDALEAEIFRMTMEADGAS